MAFILNLDLALQLNDAGLARLARLADLTNSTTKGGEEGVDAFASLLAPFLKLSDESQAILFLVEYAHLLSGLDFKCFCHYSKRVMLDDPLFRLEPVVRLVDSDLLASRFDQVLLAALRQAELVAKPSSSRFSFSFFDASLLKRNEQIFDNISLETQPKATRGGETATAVADFELMLRNLDDIDDREFFLNDTSQPSLVRLIDKTNYLVVYGLTSVYRNIVKIANLINPSERIEYLLGFKSNCLKACAEVSRWTNLCENTSISLVKEQKRSRMTAELAKTRQEFLDEIEQTLARPLKLADRNRKLAKERKQKLIAAAAPKESDASSGATKRFLEDHFITISDLILFHSLTTLLELPDGENLRADLESAYANICKWYSLVLEDVRSANKAFEGQRGLVFCGDSDSVKDRPVDELKLNQLSLGARRNDDDDEPVNAELFIYELKFKMAEKSGVKVPYEADGQFKFDYDDIKLAWSDLQPEVSPEAGGLPSTRLDRKCQQLENFVYIFKKHIYQEYKRKRASTSAERLVVCDFCSGGGHLGILLAYLFPDCVVKLIENKEESLEMALSRLNKLKLKNCFIYKGNLTNFNGKFNVGIGVHACGSATDLIIEKCVKNKADVLIAPCCYGSIKENDSLKYPRSNLYRSLFRTSDAQPQAEEEEEEEEELYPNSRYYELTSYADRTEKKTEYEQTAYECMSLIDTDRLRHISECGYRFTQLFKMKPPSCTTKNNLLFAKY